MRFHHIGYAVRDIRGYLDDFLVPLFHPVRISEVTADATQRVSVCFVEMAGGAVIELVEPLGDSSPVHSYIGSARGGVYHLCYEVDDLDAAMSAMRRKHCMPLGRPVPAAAFQGRRIVFLFTPQRDLLELVEGPAPDEAVSDG